MARQKLRGTEKEIDDAREAGFARLHYLSMHPEERAKEMAARQEKAWRTKAAHMRKHQPEVNDITDNGEEVEVAFTRNNGERVVAFYKICGWGIPPANKWNAKERRALQKVRAQDAAAGKLPPGPAGTPRS